MYVSKLEVFNYRSFKNFSIYLKPLTLIIGENNIGKSNLLDSIGLIFSQEISFFKKRFLEEADFNQKSIQRLKNNILDFSMSADEISYPVIKVIATLTDWNIDQEAVIGDWYSNEELSEAKLTYIFSPIPSFNKIEEIRKQREFIIKYKNEKGQDVFNGMSEKEKHDLINFPLSKYHYTIYGGNQSESQVNSYHLNQLKFELLDALRDASSELVASHNSKLLFRILNAKDESDYQDLKGQLIGLQNAIDKNSTLQSIKEGITDQLDKISLSDDDRTNLVDFIFSLPNIEDLLKKLSLIYGDNPIKIERNGTGRNNLLFISLMLSYIEDVRKAQNSYFRIVGLEEPEAHLHANLQDHLAHNIELLIKEKDGKKFRKDIQLLITSHSTHITTKIDFENTVVLFKNRNRIESHYILSAFPNNAKSMKQIRYLNKFLDAINTNIFYSKKIVLVEGISEKLLFPIFYKIHTDTTIEKDSCCLVNVDGLAFRNFLEIVKNGYFQKCVVITDSDSGKSVEDRAEKLRSDYLSVGQIKIKISAESTFEKDVIHANRSGTGKQILLDVLSLVRPLVAKNFIAKTGKNLISTEEFFGLISSYKSDFAYYLLLSLEEDYSGFNVPEYITSGIDFLNE